MNCTVSRGLLVCAALVLASGCTPEGFAVTPCSLNGQPAFRIHAIEGWLSDYHPRPMSVLVLEDFTGSQEEFMRSQAPYRWPGVWSAELQYDGDVRGPYAMRPLRELIVYGQPFPQWGVAQAAKPLTPGKTYSVSISDSGRHGYARFTVGKPLPACP